MKCLLIGVGAAGNKAVMTAVEKGTVSVDDTIIINSTAKDFPADYTGKKIVLSPDNAGCGKERSQAKKYVMNAINHGEFNFDVLDYGAIIIATSVEGGTGSGSAPVIAQFFKKVYNKNVHIISFIGFEEDVRGLSNTVEFFKEVTSDLVVQCIRNSAFLRECGNNKFRAEQLANEEMCKRIEILSGKNFIDSDQNIDDTDIRKVSNTSGYMTVEHINIAKPLVDQEDFNRVVKQMLYASKSLKSANPSRMGVLLNIDPASEEAVDFTFDILKKSYGNPYETFLQKQWDGKQEYIGVIVSGMKMPIEEIQDTYNRYKEESDKVNKNADEFFAAMKDLSKNEEDKAFDMIKPSEGGMSVDQFKTFMEDFGE